VFEFHGWIVLKTRSGRQFWDEGGLHEPDLKDLVRQFHERIASVNESFRQFIAFHSQAFHPTVAVT